MAYKRIIFFIVTFAICFFVGVTWADSAASNSSSTLSSTAAAHNVSTPISQAPASTATTKTAPIVPAPQTNVKSSNGTITGTPAPKCVCDGALVPRLAENGKELEICPECKCKHVARNTTLIKVVVIIVIWIISILVIYMLFLMCLDPLLNKRVKANYQEHTNEDDDTASTAPPISGSSNQELSSRANVLNRVGHQQNKWKRQVREQRRHIYDRRTMLN